MVKVSFIRIDGVMLDLAQVDVVQLDYVSDSKKPYETVVRIQMRNRRDELIPNPLVPSRPPIKVKYGVFELTPEGSVMFRWWLDMFGPAMGVMNVNEMYGRRGEIEKAVLAMRVQQEGQRLSETGAPLPIVGNNAKEHVFEMPRKCSTCGESFCAIHTQ